MPANRRGSGPNYPVNRSPSRKSDSTSKVYAARKPPSQRSYRLLENWVTSTSLITGPRQAPFPSESIVRRLISRGLIFPRSSPSRSPSSFSSDLGSSPPSPVVFIRRCIFAERRGRDLSRGPPEKEANFTASIHRLSFHHKILPFSRLTRIAGEVRRRNALDPNREASYRSEEVTSSPCNRDGGRQ